jgi:hypothetical protein
MSTDYLCHVSGEDYKETVELREHSGKLDLCVMDYDPTSIRGLTPEQVARMAIKMLEVAWYQDEEAVQMVALEARSKRYELGIKL